LAEQMAPVRSAQRGRGERESEEILDPTGSVRQAVWDARISRLREIDPDNPNLTYFANPNSPPSPEALDHLDAAIEAASIKRVRDKVIPNGVPIGRRGGGRDIRELPGGLDAARDLFDYLRVGGEITNKPDLEGTLVKLPRSAGFITFRPKSDSGSPAIDINVPGARIKFHFP
jgi:hypothetical protein